MKWLQLVSIGGFLAFSSASQFKKFPTALPHGIKVREIAPVFDFDTNGCLPAAAISQEGKVNGGLKPSGKVTGDCYYKNFMELSNTYHRYECKRSGGHEYCVHFFALYFEKDQVIWGVKNGHRHDWEVAAVWTKNGWITHGSVSAHGKLRTRTSHRAAFDGRHLKVKYYKQYYGSHAFRFAASKEKVENPTHRFVTPDIVSWFEISSSHLSNKRAREILDNTSFGRANCPINDGHFKRLVNSHKPREYPSF